MDLLHVGAYCVICLTKSAQAKADLERKTIINLADNSRDRGTHSNSLVNIMPKKDMCDRTVAVEGGWGYTRSRERKASSATEVATTLFPFGDVDETLELRANDTNWIYRLLVLRRDNRDTDDVNYTRASSDVCEYNDDNAKTRREGVRKVAGSVQALYSANITSMP